MPVQVDAALDLSHTQNIGRMIKTHFPYSQFVVVSLKEGMFSNANVIFRTKFVDGVSTVTRSANDRARCAQGSKQATRKHWNSLLPPTQDDLLHQPIPLFHVWHPVPNLKKCLSQRALMSTSYPPLRIQARSGGYKRHALRK